MVKGRSLRPMNSAPRPADLHCAPLDAIIAGGGLVGLSLGLALHGQGLKVAVVDAALPATALEPTFDGRAFAIAAASQRMLDALGLWGDVSPHAQPINDILVSDGRLQDRFRAGGPAPHFLHFDPRELLSGEGRDSQPLGYMVESRHLRQALYAQAQVQGLSLIAPVRVRSLNVRPEGVEAILDDGARLSAKVCLAAEGKNSGLRKAAGIKTVGWTYNQHGIVTTVEHDLDHEGLAQEYFLPSGPFAILPLAGRRSSLVWTERSDLAPVFMDLDEAAFTQQIVQRFGAYLGAVRPVGPRWCYPLGLQLAREYVAPRLALAGDAAHAIHPIAGQGLNLGLRDVAALGEVLVDARRLGLDIGGADILARYQRWRRFDSFVLAMMMDQLNRLFANDWGPLRMARDLGLRMVNQLGPARRFFMRHAQGAVGDLPRLLRGEAL